MASRVIDVALKLRDAFTGPMKGAISSLTSFDKEGTRVRKSVEKVGKGIAGVGTAMTAAVTADDGIHGRTGESAGRSN